MGTAILAIQKQDDMAVEIQRMAPLLQVFDMPASIVFMKSLELIPINPIKHFDKFLPTSI
ncbi:MAG: hypothetical protein DMG50_20690 [Acidobacteria bacterium]|nr:MAG: hypothetical protein DMG50_20690 [Acidobacteriota bacterium]